MTSMRPSKVQAGLAGSERSCRILSDKDNSEVLRSRTTCVVAFGKCRLYPLAAPGTERRTYHDLVFELLRPPARSIWPVGPGHPPELITDLAAVTSLDRDTEILESPA